LILLLSGAMSASTAANGAHAQTIFLSLPFAVEAPLVVALADPLTARVEPAATQADELPIATEDDGTAIASRAAPTLARPAPASAAYAPARFFTINQVLAKRNIRVDVTPTVQLAAVDPATTATDAAPLSDPNYGGEPFGLFTFRAPEGLLWAKWRKAQADIRAETPILAQCQAEPDRCTPAAARFNAVVAEAKTQQGRARIEIVNERINAAIRYTSDMAQYGVPDLWSAPLASFATGLGDCEDYAIAKYVALRNAGVADSDLHLLLVHDNAVQLDHAVLAVRDDGHWLILDNRWTRLAEDTELKQFAPLFALDEQGVKLFAAPYAALGLQNDGGDAFIAGADQGVILADPTPAAEADADASPWTFVPPLL
jgi:predicted transglutaminase-like cysteine proteinase